MHFKEPSRFMRLSAIALTALLASTGLSAQTTFTNTLGMTFVQIPAGSFMMGSCDIPTSSKADRIRDEQREFLGQAADKAPEVKCQGEDNSNRDEKPRHNVTLKSFWLGATEVTLGQFKKFLLATNRNDIMSGVFLTSNRKSSDEHAVVAVTWDHAQDFIKWLNQVDGKGYRLPSESEWEYACNAGQYKKYCGMSANERGIAKWDEPVNFFKPNPWGLRAITGNAGEWVEDAYFPSYEGAPTDGSARQPNSAKADRVFRGAQGSWGGHTTERNRREPKIQSSSVGFRVARDR